MQRTKWLDRKFSFDYPEGWIFNILERLRGTVPRLRDMTSGLSESHAALRFNDKWSIKEHIGHLSDLEPLWDGRLDDFMAGLDTLRAADMSNAATTAANHNEKTLAQLIDEFARRRYQLLAKFEQLPDEVHMQQALHPRLLVMMRPVDAAYFTAEHDAHHLCDIYNLIPAR